MTYPTRPPFFAYKYTRLLSKVCAPHELGPYATLLCITVAMQEDAIRYKRAVTFFNDHLRNLVGVAKWETLNKARSRAVSKGWLYYENQGKRQPGIYWAMVPEIHRDLLEERCILGELHPDDGYKRGYRDGYKEGYSHGYKGGDPSTLYPGPDPEPGKPRASQPAEDLFDGQPDPPPKPIADEDRWRMDVSAQGWARDLVKAGAKIGPKNWTVWQALIEAHTLANVLAGVASVDPTARWPDQVETHLGGVSRQRTKDWGQEIR